MRVLLVVNPVATGLTPSLRTTTERRLHAACDDLTVVETAHGGHACEIARDAAGRTDAIVVLGGDGTVNEVATGLMPDPSAVPARVPVGIVPAGSANVFARSVGLPRSGARGADVVAGALAVGRAEPVGLASAVASGLPPRWVLFALGVGLDAEIVEQVERLRARGRRATSGRYLRAGVLQHLLRTERRTPHLTAASAAPDGTAAVEGGLFYVLVAATSPWTYLGARPVQLAPGTRSDGPLGVVGLRSVSTPVMLRAMAESLLRPRTGPTGAAVARLRGVTEVVVTADAPTAVQVDGDAVGHHTRVVVRRVPAALRVLR